MYRKGMSILPFAFIALVIALGIISWSFYNVYYGSKYQSTVFEHSKLDTMRNEIEKSKRFTRESCIYSSHQSLFENAIGGGIIPEKGTTSNTWICNVPQPPTVSKTKNCLETFTNFYLNVYYGNLTIDLPVEIAKAPFESSIYNISRRGVFSGQYDEGNMDVNSEEAKISLTTDNLQITDNLDQNERIDKNRFWYLWVTFYKWAQDNVYGKGICECTSNCGGPECAEKVAQEALKDLEERFDEYVTCTKSCDCVYGCQGSDCGISEEADCGTYCEPSDCLPWKQDKCISECNKDCTDPEDRYPGVGNVTNLTDLLDTSFEQVYMTEDYQNTAVEDSNGDNGDDGGNEEECCPIYKENKLSAVYTFSCTDKKYNVPTGNGPEPMTFQVKAFATYKDKDGCGCEMQCPCKDCPQNEGEEC